MTTVFIPQPTPSTENMKTRLANETSLAGESGEPYLVADLFCGAGGSSTGAERAIALTGRRMELVAVNHWPVAVETHQLNHPTARHYVQDIERADPEAIVPGGRLDLLMASPECTYHSRARGGKPIHDQGRMHPWAVHNWLARLDVNAVLVENVPEFADWGPLDENDRPDKSQKGLHFQTWFLRFHSLGYKAEWRMLNAADHGDATSRVRFFLMARKDELPIRWPEPSHAKGDTGMLPGRRPWRGAREIINWNNLGRSLLEDPKYRKKPLSVKTRQRIARGLQRFGGPLAPLYIRLLDLPAEEGETPEQTTAPERAATPERADPGNRGGFILNRHGENGSVRVHSVADPTPTATTRGAGIPGPVRGQPLHSRQPEQQRPEEHQRAHTPCDHRPRRRELPSGARDASLHARAAERGDAAFDRRSGPDHRNRGGHLAHTAVTGALRPLPPAEHPDQVHG